MIKKQLIMEKALELFADKGIESTSIQQITEHCGISKGAFYLSFKSKDELVLALIDHFMMEITTDIDRVVKSVRENSELLYHFYYTTFQSFHKHSNFAKILIKEQAHSFNEELIMKTRYYDRLNEEIILSMIERLYGEEIQHTKFDLIYCIKGFMRIYSELFLFYNVELDLNLLSQSLVEKTNLLARNMTLPFISKELIERFNEPLKQEITKAQLIEMIVLKIAELEDSDEKESLILLKEQIIERTLSPVIIKGLIANIRHHPQCKWIAYLLGDGSFATF